MVCGLLWMIPFCMVLSTVFVVDKQLVHSTISGKYFWFYAAMGISSMAVLLSVVIYKRPIRFTLWDGLILLFAACGLWVTYYHSGEMTTKWILLLLLLVLYFYFRIIFAQNRWHLLILLLFFVVTGLIEAVWGLRQLYGFTFSQHGHFKTTGSFFNPGPYAGYLAVVFPMALSYYWAKGEGLKAKAMRVLAVVTCIAILLILPATMSRASWLAAIAGSLAVIIMARYPLKNFKKLLTNSKSVLLICLVVILACSALCGMYFLKKDSADGRTLMWKVALQAVPKYPFGVGLGNFPGTYASEQAVYFESGKGSEQEELVAGSPEYGFNEYLQMAVEWGIIPFMLFLTIIVGSFYLAFKQQQWGIIGSLIALLVFAFMSYPFSILPFPIVLVFLLAAIQSNNKNGRRLRIKPAMTILIVAMTCLLVAFSLYNRYPTYEAYKKWNFTQKLYQAKAYDSATKEYALLYPYLNDQINFLFEYGQSLSHTGDYEKSNEILQQASRLSGDPMIYNIMGKNYQALRKYEQAESYFLKASQIVPHRLYPWYLLCKLYAEMGLHNKANEMAVIVLTKEPKVQSTAVREMREEVRKLRDNN